MNSNALLEAQAYDRARWWDPEDELYAMGILLNQARYPYFFDVLTRRLMHAPAELSVLDVGCGGGSLSLLFARSGFEVTGIDADRTAIEAGRDQAAKVGIDVDFITGSAESLPFGAGKFDVVVASEVLEHVADLRRTLDEVCRVLKFGGVLLFSTPNRSLLSYLLLVKLAQDWGPTRVLNSIEHDFRRLVKPGELRRELESRGIDVYETAGVTAPLSSLPGAFIHYLRHKSGRAPLSHVAASLRLRTRGTKALAYVGWGIKFG